MNNKTMDKPRSIVYDALAASRGAFVMTILFSCVINLLMLVSPIYMLQVYDRVLTSRSEETLMALSVMAIGLLLILGALDLVRTRVLARIGAQVDQRLSQPVFTALQSVRLRGGETSPTRSLSELDALRQFLTGPGLSSLFDSPWVPLYLVVLYWMNPVLGMVAIIGAVVLFAIALLNDWLTRRPLQRANGESAQARQFATKTLRNAEALEAMGMFARMRERWLKQHNASLITQMTASDRGGMLIALSKTIRMCLQTAILGMGALLAIEQVISPGVMIAASIIMGRALAPVEQAIHQWRGFVAARGAYHKLSELMDKAPKATEPLTLPAPKGHIAFENVIGGPPGNKTDVLRRVSFALKPGASLGIIGPTASGKSTLARMLVGVWLPRMGTVRLDGAVISDWPSDDRGQYVGYLPQDVELFAGTIAQNISRFAESPDPESVVSAAQHAGVHELILRLSDGYETQIGDDGTVLSGGQRQRIGLARALYANPSLVVLDEPNANLDTEGDAALGQAIVSLKERGCTVVVIAHRPSALTHVDQLMVLRDGLVQAFGPKQTVLAKIAEAGGNLSKLHDLGANKIAKTQGVVNG